MSMATDAWEIDFCAGYIVPPCRNQEIRYARNEVKGSSISLKSDVIAKFLRDQFIKSETDCDIEVVFNSVNGNLNQNLTRQLVMRLNADNGDERDVASKELAVKLALALDNRSFRIAPSCLFIVMQGHNDDIQRICIYTLPADETLQATFSSDGLNMSVVKGAFSRRSELFKAAMYEGRRHSSAFSIGFVQDSQAKQRTQQAANFWISDFLQSRATLTDERGSMLIGKHLREVISDKRFDDERESLIHVAVSIKSHSGEQTTLSTFADTYLPSIVRAEFLAALESVANIPFKIDKEALDKELAYRTIVLSTGLSITGPLDRFDTADTMLKHTDERTKRLRYIALYGKIINDGVNGKEEKVKTVIGQSVTKKPKRKK